MKAIRVVLAAALATTAASAGAKGSVEWSGREPHPAVVNPVCGYEAGVVLDLGGEWEFSWNKAAADRHQFFRQREHERTWKDARKIRVPGNWEAQGVGEPVPKQERRTYDGYRQLPLGHYFNGHGWYRRTVTVPAGWKGRRIWLKVGGVGSQGWFWVNGQPVAHVFDYCATRKFEITDLVKPGEGAQFVVEVSNAGASKHGYRDSCCIWGGITRALELEATPRVFIDDAWARGDFDRQEAEVHVDVDCSDCSIAGVRVEIEGKVVEQAIKPSDNRNHRTTVSVPLRSFRPWTPESPNLYTARVELVVGGKVAQVRTERFGVRKLEVRGCDIYLNGRPFFWRGVGFHEIDPMTGLHPADLGFYRDRIAKIRACGFNAVRLHTHCESPEFFEAADELGLLVQPELPYYGDHPVHLAPFEPLADAEELYLNFRRHPSFAVYSGGNEGSFGPVLGKRFYDEVKARDPDRLVLEQTTIGYNQWPGRGHVGTTDLVSQPGDVWPRGKFNPDRPLLAHEYMNLAVKIDTRLEDRYTGVWQAPMKRSDRDAWLARFGLGRAFGDRLQDAQHALQAVWQKRGIESARKDPYCDGYYFWSMLDATCINMIGWTGKIDWENLTFMAQGVLNPFFEEKRCGQTVAGFAVFNSPVGVFVDTDPEDLQVVAGERLKAKVFLANYGAATLAAARFEWRVTDEGGRPLASGAQDVGDRPVGPVEQVAALDFAVPDVKTPVAGRLEVSVAGHANRWPCWLFPRRTKRDGRDLAAFGAMREAVSAAYDGILPATRAAEAKVVIADYGSPEAAAALKRGQTLVAVGGLKGPANVKLGWWFLNGIVGAVFDAESPVLRHLPSSPSLSTLHFRIFKKGLRLPLDGFAPEGLIAVSEEGKGCFAHLAERVQPNGARHLVAYGLALDQPLPEAVAILDGLVDRARMPIAANERRSVGGIGGPNATEAAAGATATDVQLGGSGRE